MITNDTFLRALRREPTPHTPIWLMRQAGRYLPEYNATRAKAGSFIALARTPELCAEVALQPLARFPLDAAIVFSDILTIPDAMGLGLSFTEGEGPRFARPLRDEAAIRALAAPDMNDLRYVFDAVAVTKRALGGRVPLIGFAGSPFTLACYMIEGAGSADFASVRTMAYARPDLVDRIVARNTDAAIRYLAEQVAHGADALMLFDTWGGLLSAEAYRRFSLASMKAIVQQFPSVPTIVFTRGGGAWLDEIAACGASCVGLDWTVDIASARSLVGSCTAHGSCHGRAGSNRDRASSRRRSGACLQPRTWRRAGDAAGQRRGPRRRRACELAGVTRRGMKRFEIAESRASACVAGS
jgi:uroporphyrinogen decarboxylase